eukprot:8113107-Pyramimonas_sp.AAC.1
MEDKGGVACICAMSARVSGCHIDRQWGVDVNRIGADGLHVGMRMAIWPAVHLQLCADESARGFQGGHLTCPGQRHTS